MTYAGGFGFAGFKFPFFTENKTFFQNKKYSIGILQHSNSAPQLQKLRALSTPKLLIDSGEYFTPIHHPSSLHATPLFDTSQENFLASIVT